jgi:hypothetical protein
MNRVAPMLLALAFSLPAVAQTHIDAGVSVGQQAYESSADDPRVLTGVELLARRNAVGLLVAMEYADLSFDGTMLATHVDGIYRFPFSDNFSATAGAGVTYVSVETLGGRYSWNAFAEVARRWGRTEVFARVRQYDYSIGGFRRTTASPKGPAVSVGVRFAIRRPN